MKLGIALSGGGIRGIAHAGVLQALEDYGISIDIIGGTSAGSMIASLYAMGYSPYTIYLLFKRYAKDIIETNSISWFNNYINSKTAKNFTLTGMKNGAAIEDIYNRLAERKGITKISQIKMPIVIPTVDVMQSKEYVFTNYYPINEEKEQYITDISVGKAVRASSSLPAVFNPCLIEKHAFMDGGALDNVPVHEVKKQGADKVIAVKFDADTIDEGSNFMDIAMKIIDIMGNKISEENLEMSDLILNVYTDKCGLFDIDKLDKCYEYGYLCVKENIEKIRNLIK